MSEPTTSCDSAGWRCATACSSTARPTGPPRSAAPTARSQVASGRKPRARGRRRPRTSPALRGVAKLGEAMAVIPLVKRALPEARLPMQNVAHARRDGRRRAGRPGDPLARRGTLGREAAVGARQPRAGAARPARRRAGRLPRRRAQVDRRLRAGRRRRATPTRSTTAAARTWSRRCWPRPRSGNVAARRAGLRGPGRRGGRRAGQHRRSRSRCSPGPSATTARRLSRMPCAARASRSSARSGRASRRATARGGRGRARRDPARREADAVAG